MAPSRKGKSVNKRPTTEASPEIDIGRSSKTKQRKKKLTDKLGPQWTKGELQRFYDAYRKHGRVWKKLAAAVRNNRSVDMVEALYYMNRAYLSLSEGTASVAGLIAMMTDHYSIIEESESEGEGHYASEVMPKHQKRKRAKVPISDSQDVIISPYPIASAEGCIPFLKQLKAYEKERRATAKRTPRFPIPSPYERDDREGSTAANKRAKKSLDADDASRSGGGSPYRRTEHDGRMPVRLGEMSLAKKAQSRHHGSSIFENGVRIPRERRHKTGAPDRDGALLMDLEGFSTLEVPLKGKTVRLKEAEQSNSDDSGEACIASEGLRTKLQKRMVDIEASTDELDALEALTGLKESESSAHLKEERKANNVYVKSYTPETVSPNRHREKAKQARPEDSIPHAISAADDKNPKSVQESVKGNAVSVGELVTSKRKRKLKVLGVETSKDPIQNKSLYNKEPAEDDDLKTLVKARRACQGPEKQLKITKTSEEPSSTSDKKRSGTDAVVSATQVSGLVLVSLPQKPQNRRKMSLKKSLQGRAKSSETSHDKPRSYGSFPEHELLKEKVSNCLSYPLVRRRCIFEWFYSAIDYPWFAEMEFADYLNHVGIGNAPRLTRLEWSVIKSSIGRPRRFSERFIQKERDKLKQYRETVRELYTELRAGDEEVLHTDMPQPLSVGNRVIAIHPKTREIRDGKILTVNHNECSVLFDELGIELVKDIDCMPLNPLEYMAEGLSRQIEKCLFISKEEELNRHPNSDASVQFAPMSANVNFPMNLPVKKDDINGQILHGKVLAANTNNQYIRTNSKARRTETQRASMLQHTSDVQEMEPEIMEIFNGSKSRAQAMVEAAIKAASSLKKDDDAGNKVHQALSSIGEHQLSDNSIVPGIKYQDHINGSLDHHQSRSPSNLAEPMTNGFISTQIPSELITSCVATWLMIQMCTEKQYPPAEVAQLMETAVKRLQPGCPQNMPIYREIQTCMGLIKTQIMSLVRT